MGFSSFFTDSQATRYNMQALLTLIKQYSK